MNIDPSFTDLILKYSYIHSCTNVAQDLSIWYRYIIQVTSSVITDLFTYESDIHLCYTWMNITFQGESIPVFGNNCFVIGHLFQTIFYWLPLLLHVRCRAQPAFLREYYTKVICRCRNENTSAHHAYAAATVWNSLSPILFTIA